MKRIARLLDKLDRAGARAEDALLLLILISMILLLRFVREPQAAPAPA